MNPETILDSDWWTNLHDFEGGWCACTGTKRKLPNIILNIWYRQSGKTRNLCKLALDYKIKNPSKNVGIISAGSHNRHIISELREICDEMDIKYNDMKGIRIGTPYQSGIINERLDLLLLDEFCFFSRENIAKVIDSFSNIIKEKKCTMICWSSPSGEDDFHFKKINQLRIKGGTRIATNYFSFYDNLDNEEKDIPSYLGEYAINNEYLLKCLKE
jgi:hypothetical protein